MDRDNNRGKRRQSEEENQPEVDTSKREKNRLAAKKCRENKEKQMQELKAKNHELQKMNKKLSEEKRNLKEQALSYKKMVEMHCDKGCKIPVEMVQLWNTEIVDDTSSDEDSSEGNELCVAGLFEESNAPASSSVTSQHLQPTLLDDAGRHFEAPIALFSGRPLDAPQMNRRRSYSSSTSVSSPLGPSNHVPLRSTSSSTFSDLSSMLAAPNLPSALAPISTRSDKDVRIQEEMTATTSTATNNIPRAMSNLAAQPRSEIGTLTSTATNKIPRALSNLVVQPRSEVGTLTSSATSNIPTVISNLVVQPRSEVGTLTSSATSNIPRVISNHTVQPRSEVGTLGQLPDDSSEKEMEVSEQITTENQNGGNAEKHPVSNEEETYLNLPSFSSFAQTVEGYTFLEDLQKMISTNENAQNGNCNNGGSHFQSHSESMLTVPVHAMAPALLNIGPEMSQSLRQQIKTSFSSVPSLPTENIAQVGQPKIQNIIRPNVMAKSRSEELTESTTQQVQLSMHNVRPMIARRKVQLQSETISSRETQAVPDQSVNMPQGIAANKSLKATVMSQEQLFTLTQKQTSGQNSQSGYLTESQELLRPLQYGQQMTRSFTTNDVISSALNNASHTVVHAPLNNASHTVVHAPLNTSQPVEQHALEESTNTTNGFNALTVTDYDDTVIICQPGLNTSSSSALQSVPQTTSVRTTNGFVPSTATSNNGGYTNTQTMHTSPDRILQHSPSQMTNAGTINGHRRPAVTRNNGTYTIAPPSSLSSQQRAQQRASQTHRANNTDNGLIPSVGSINAVYSNIPAGLNTTARQRGPQISRANVTNGNTSAAIANNGGYTRTLSASNTSSQPGFQYPNPTTSVTASGGYQSVINTRMPSTATASSREMRIQASPAIGIHAGNGYFSNTAASTAVSYSGTDIADQLCISTSSETPTQHTMISSDVNYRNQQGSVWTLEDSLSVADTPQGTYQDTAVPPADIDYFPASPQTDTSTHIVANDQDMFSFTLDNVDFGISFQNIPDLNFNTHHSFNNNLPANCQTVTSRHTLNK